MAVTKSSLVVDIKVDTKNSDKNITVLSGGLKELKDNSEKAGKSTDKLSSDLSNIGSSSTKAAGDIEKLNHRFDGMGGKAEKAGSSFEVFSSGLIKIYAAVQLAETAFRALHSVFDSTVGAYAEAEESSKKLGNTLRALGERDVETATKRFEALATAIETQTGADADQILGLIQRGKALGITNENLEIMVALAAKLPAAFGGTIESSFEALVDSTNGMGRGLKQFGNGLKDMSEESLRSGAAITKLQDVLKNSSASTGTLNESMAKVKTQFGNLAEATGKFLVDGLHIDQLLNGLVSVLTSAAAFMEKLTSAVKDANLSFEEMAVVLGPIAVSFGIIFSAQILKSVTNLVGLVRALSAGFLLLSLKVIAVAAAILAVFGIVELLVRNFNKLGQVGLLAFDFIKLGIAKLTGNGGEVVKLNKEIEELKKGLDFGVTGEAIGKVSDIFGKLTGSTDGAKKSTDALGNALAGMNGKYKAAKLGLSAEEIKKQLDNAAKEIEKYQGFITGLKDRSLPTPITREEGVFQQKAKDQEALDVLLKKSAQENLKLGKSKAKVEAEILKAKQAVVDATVAGLQKADVETAKEMLALGQESIRLTLEKNDALKNERNEQLGIIDGMINKNDELLNQMAREQEFNDLAASGDKRKENLQQINEIMKQANYLHQREFELLISANQKLRDRKLVVKEIADAKLAKEIQQETLEIQKEILEIDKKRQQIGNDNTKIQNYKEENRQAILQIELKKQSAMASFKLEIAEGNQSSRSTEYYKEASRNVEAQIKAINEKTLALSGSGKAASDAALLQLGVELKVANEQKKYIDDNLESINKGNVARTVTLVRTKEEIRALYDKEKAQKRLTKALIDSTPKEVIDWVESLNDSIIRAFGDEQKYNAFFKNIKDNILSISDTVLDVFIVKHVEEVNAGKGGITDEQATKDKMLKQQVDFVKQIAAEVFDMGGKYADIAGNVFGLASKSISNMAGWVGTAIDAIMNLPSLLSKLTEIPAALIKTMDMVPGLIQKVAEEFPSLVTSLAEKLPSFFVSLVNKIPMIIQTVLDSLPLIIERLAELLPELFVKIIGMIPSIIGKIVKAIFQVIQGFVKGFIRGITNALKGKKTAAIPDIAVAQKGAPKEALAKLSGQADRLFSVKDMSDKAASGTEKIEQVIEASNKAADKRRLSTWQLIGKAMTALWDGMGLLLTKVWQSLWGGFTKVWDTVVGGTVKALKAIVEALGKAVGMLWGGLKWVVMKLFEGISSLFDWLEHPEKFIEALKEGWTQVMAFVSKLWEGLVAIIQVPIDIITLLFNTVGKIFSDAFGGIIGIFDGLFDNVSSSFASVTVLFDGLKSLVADAFQFVSDLFAGLAAGVKTAFQFVKDIFDGLAAGVSTAFQFVKNIFDGLATGVSTAFQFVKDMFDGLATGVSTAFQFVKDIFDGLAAGVKTAFQFVADIFTGMSTAVSTAFEGIKGIGTAIWEGFKEGLTGATDFLKGIGTAIWDGIKGGLAGIGEIFSGVKFPEFTWPEITIPTITIPKITLPSFDLTSLTTKLTDAGKKFASAVSTGLKAPFNLIIDLINSIKFPAFDWSISAGRLGSWSGRFWDEIDIIPGQIARLAKGGPVEGMEPFGTDTVPAMLSPGEFIMNKEATSMIGLKNLRSMNSGNIAGLGGSSVSNNTNNITIEVSIDAKVALDKNYVQDKLVPEIKSALKRASLNGEFILSDKGIR